MHNPTLGNGDAFGLGEMGILTLARAAGSGGL
jgi:hypothetical protein